MQSQSTLLDMFALRLLNVAKVPESIRPSWHQLQEVLRDLRGDRPAHGLRSVHRSKKLRGSQCELLEPRSASHFSEQLERRMLNGETGQSHVSHVLRVHEHTG